MSKPKKEETVMSKALSPQKLMTACVQCMMSGDMFNMLLLHISDHKWDKEHMDIVDGMDGPLV